MQGVGEEATHAGEIKEEARTQQEVIADGIQEAKRQNYFKDMLVCQDQDRGLTTGLGHRKHVSDCEKSSLLAVIWAEP